jgi:hypothetical protein
MKLSRLIAWNVRESFLGDEKWWGTDLATMRQCGAQFPMWRGGHRMASNESCFSGIYIWGAPAVKGRRIARITHKLMQNMRYRLFVVVRWSVCESKLDRRKSWIEY